MKKNLREIRIFYNPEIRSHRMAVAHAQSLVSYVEAYAFDKAPLNDTCWEEILAALDIDPKELLNKADPYYQTNIKGREFDQESWIHILRHNPNLIQWPIAVRGYKAVICHMPTDIHQLMDTEECQELLKEEPALDESLCPDWPNT
jgi:arsenate reductase (glutaredoxin)